MMSGLQEILIIILIILVILFAPRMLGSRPSETRLGAAALKKISGAMRLKIALSFFWLIIAALWRQPWHNGWIPYLTVGILPLLIFWVGQWVFSGFKISSKSSENQKETDE